jgi:hypothetical protein
MTPVREISLQASEAATTNTMPRKAFRRTGGLPAIDEDDSVDGSSMDLDFAEPEPAPKKKRKDEKLVAVSRIVVMGVLTVSALVIALMTYNIVSKDEYENFVAEVRI